MSALPHELEADAAGPPGGSGSAPPPGHVRLTWLVFLSLVGAYALLLNPYWTPGGDSELFLAAARSLNRGEGYVYNEKVVAVSPPGWPVMLAGVMEVSDRFLVLKTVTLLLMAGAWTAAHRVLLRLASPGLATFAAIAGGLLVLSYSLTFWLHSDALFCLLAWLAALAAVRVAEGSGWRWAVVGLVVCCAGMAAVRWIGPLQWVIVASLLLAGWRWDAAEMRRQAFGRVGVGVGLTAVVTVVVFALLYFGLPRLAWADAPVAPASPAAQVEAGTDDAAAASPVQMVPYEAMQREDARPDVLDNRFFENLPRWREQAWRLANAGAWVSWLLWYPSRFLEASPALRLVPVLIGWLVLGLIAVRAWDGLRRGAGVGGPAGTAGGGFDAGRFLWPAVVGYVLALAWMWPLPNARYLVPISPLLVLGTLQGLAVLGRDLPRLGRAARIVFIAAIVGVNGMMYAVDVAVQRSGDPWFGGGRNYYHTYEAGLHASLLGVIEELERRGAADGQVAVSERYFNLNRMRFSRAGSRNAVMLLDRTVISAPPGLSFPPGAMPPESREAERFERWMTARGVRYYLYQQPAVEWRLWHFRVPGWLQTRLGGDIEDLPEPIRRTVRADEAGPASGWLLYSWEDGFREPVGLAEEFEPVRRVPGVGRNRAGAREGR